ncbi:MAG: hypothetical protein NC401_12190 [Ruminococcus sp.]|nr:hypothetical protein [Ruminococcus sp.]MCM1439021.1 hypothetical protein [Roseburia sp.]
MSNNISGIVPQYDLNKIAAKLKTSVEDAVANVIKRLQYIGEKCIEIARENGDYNDITGNLRSSIGYVVLHDGVVVTQSVTRPTSVAPGERAVKRTRKDGTEYIAKQKIGGDGAQGTKAANELLSRLQSKYPRGCVLIVCAGMEYAAYVENVHGKRVLVDAELKAEQLCNRFFGKRSKRK